MTRTIKFALAALAIAAIAAPAAFADAGKSQVSLRIAYSDLDMTTPMGGQTLLGRIDGAARKICDEADHKAKPDENGTYKCRRRTVESAVRAMNKPMLSLAWNGKGETTSFASR
jgi:UrcA family protein